MGHRLHLGLGYGIILTKEEKKKVNYQTVEDAYIPYFRELYDKYDKKLFSDGKDLEESLDLIESLLIWSKVNGDRQKKIADIENEKDRDETLWHRLFNIVVDWILYPNKEIGSKSFFGYIAENHYSDVMNYALTYCLLRPEAKEYECFEIKLPPTNFKDKAEIIEGKDGKSTIIPQRELLFDPIFRKKLIEKKDGKKKLDFKSVKEVEEFVDNYWKHHSYEGAHFERGLKLVKVMFPKKTMDDIDRYIVGWWS